MKKSTETMTNGQRAAELYKKMYRGYILQVPNHCGYEGCAFFFCGNDLCATNRHFGTGIHPEFTKDHNAFKKHLEKLLDDGFKINPAKFY